MFLLGGLAEIDRPCGRIRGNTSLVPVFRRRRGERNQNSSETALSEADRVWNRAAMERGGEHPRQGDTALAALLSLHNLAMSGGLLDAIGRHSPEQIDEAVSGFRYFGLDDAAAVVLSIVEQAASVDMDAEPEAAGRLEAEADGRYDSAVPQDSTLVAHFERVFRERRDAFAALRS